MPTTPRRWSSRLEEQRAGADSAAQRAEADSAKIDRLLTEALSLLRHDPEFARQLILEARVAAAQIGLEQQRIQRLMLEARIGRD
jgi:hypothetical protein